MIQSFGDKHTEALFNDEFVRRFEGFARAAKRKLEAVNAASRLEDVMVPPSNRLEKLKGDRKGWWSIRISDQYRVVFRWDGEDAWDVGIVDYH
jgi:proteic killer suppression protein